MSFGAEFTNDEGRYVISGFADTLYYVGKADFVIAFDDTGSGPMTYIYRVTSPGRPIPFVYASLGYAAVSSICYKTASGK